jgi:ribosomal protein S27AE
MVSFQPDMSHKNSPQHMRDMLRLTRPWADEEKLDRLVISLSKKHIHQAVTIAIKRGIIIQATQCSVCPASSAVGSAKRIVAHHDDYNKPLSIRWLCTKCHATWHQLNEPIPMAPALEGLTRYQYLTIGKDQGVSGCRLQVHEDDLSADILTSLEAGGRHLWDYCVEVSEPRFDGAGHPYVD